MKRRSRLLLHRYCALLLSPPRRLDDSRGFKPYFKKDAGSPDKGAFYEVHARLSSMKREGFTHEIVIC